MSDKIVLYRTKPDEGFWLTDASIGDVGGLSICSGDSSAEWYVKVAAADLKPLLVALRARRDATQQSTTDAEPGTAAADLDEIMTLLLELFGNGDANPFEAIKVFLGKVGIPWKSDFWGSI